MKRVAALLLSLMLLMSLAYVAGEEHVSVIVDWEPRDCGEVIINPSDGNYSYGAQIVLIAKPLESCRFSRWVTNLIGLNNTITNPLYVTLFNDAYFKAVFIKIGAEKTTTSERTVGEYVFVKISANISKFKVEVKVARIGESVWISAPREIFINDTARYVFVGWGGDLSIVTTEPIARITVTKNTEAIALYKLYLRFLELWYPAEEFTYFYAPVLDIGQGVRMISKGLRISFANLTLPLNTPIPRAFTSVVEPVYVKEYRLSIRCIDCGKLYLTLNGKMFSVVDYLGEWFEANSTINLRIMDEETPTAWVLSLRNHHLIMDGPKNLVIECEVKPHAWSYGSPLYPILQYVVQQFKNTSLYPFISNIVFTPSTTYLMIGFIFGALAGIGYGLTILARRLANINIKPSDILFEKFIGEKVKQPEKILEAIPKTGKLLEREYHIEDSQFPDIYLPSPKNISNPYPSSVIVDKPKEELVKIEKPSIDLGEFLKMVKNGRVDANILVNVVAEHPSIFKELLGRRLELEGEFKLSEVEEALKKLKDSKAIVLYGGDRYAREYIVQSIRLEYIRLEKVFARNMDEAWRTIQKIKEGKVIVLSETVDDATFRNFCYAAKLANILVIKLSIEPLEGVDNVETSSPNIFKLFGYIAYKTFETRVEIGLEEAVKLAKIARAMRGYETIDRYFKESSKSKVDLNNFEASESSQAFSEEEIEALSYWMKYGKPEQALEHYRNIVSQIDPVRYVTRMKIFKEKLEKLSRLGKELLELKEKLKEEGEEIASLRRMMEEEERAELDIEKIFSEVEEMGEIEEEDGYEG